MMVNVLDNIFSYIYNIHINHHSKVSIRHFINNGCKLYFFFIVTIYYFIIAQELMKLTSICYLILLT